MPLTRSTARRYAEAAFEIARRDGSLDAWLEAMAVAEERLSDPSIARLLSNPALPVSRRVALLDEVLAGRVTGPPRNLLALLVRRGRFEQLPGIIRELRRLHAREQGIVEADVVSAAELDEPTREALRERLQALTGLRVEMRHAVDPGLLGGIRVRIGDQLIDGSVRGRLERLRAAFSSTAS